MPDNAEWEPLVKVAMELTFSPTTDCQKMWAIDAAGSTANLITEPRHISLMADQYARAVNPSWGNRDHSEIEFARMAGKLVEMLAGATWPTQKPQPAAPSRCKRKGANKT